MAGALKCDACGTLYTTYKVKPRYNTYPAAATGFYTRLVIQLCVKPVAGDEFSKVEIDLCSACLCKVVEVYLKAIQEV